MSDKKVSPADVQRVIENLSKGLKGSGNTTPVTGEASGVGAPSQIHHMPDSSKVTSHAGTVTEEVRVNGVEYSPNGTDVNYGAMAKSIIDLMTAGKLEFGQAMEMLEVLKGMPWLEGKGPKTDKDFKDESKAGKKDGDEDEDEDDKKKKKDKKVEKSLADHAAESADVSDGMDVSDFLKGFVETVSKSLADSESRIVSRVVAEIKASASKQEGFSKSLVGALEVVGQGLSATNTRIEQVESSPAAAPKSRVGAGEGILAKSFGGEEVNLSRQTILNALVDMVTVKKSLTDSVLVKFESVGEISDKHMKQVIAHIQGK